MGLLGIRDVARVVENLMERACRMRWTVGLCVVIVIWYCRTATIWYPQPLYNKDAIRS